MDALFLLRRKNPYDGDYTATAQLESNGTLNYQAASGMWTSAKMVVDTLTTNNIVATQALLNDANEIDAIVVNTNADTIFIEGLWVTPMKFRELLSLPRHSGRTWIVRIHSDMPFLASEGVAFDWMFQYVNLGVKIAPNSPRLYRELKIWLKALGFTPEAITATLIYLPNCYNTNFRQFDSAELNFNSKDTIDIGCFGAVRLLKNHVIQAHNALEFSQKIGKPLRWHYNDNLSQNGTGPLKNMIDMLSHVPNVELIEHPWQPHAEFLSTLQGIDILMQVSMSETMNIVAADATWVGRPMIVSEEINWAFPMFGDANFSDKTQSVMATVYARPEFFVNANRDGLRQYAQTSEVIWVRLFRPEIEPASAMSNPSVIPQTRYCCG